MKSGTLHPITLLEHEVYKILTGMGFEITSAQELEDEWHNFDALRVEKDHPARDMQDTFYLKNLPGMVMRTHTSNTQIRRMKQLKELGVEPPFAFCTSGKVYRNESTDATHETQFHQVEGVVVGEGISVAHFKGVLMRFFKELYGESADVKLRPSFFPFVEPGFEFAVLKGDKWLELGGGGMIHPEVIENGGYDSKKYSGFAFGMGLDRLAVIKYGITDVRFFYSGDERINQF